MPGKKVIIRAVITLDLRDGLTMEDFLTEMEGAMQSTGEDYGDNVTVTID